MAITTFGDWVWFHPEPAVSCNVAGCHCGTVTDEDFRASLKKSLKKNSPLWRQLASEPQRCPVCDGRGTVPMGFYNHTYDGQSSSAAEPPTEPCRGCSGTGVVWPAPPK